MADNVRATPSTGSTGALFATDELTIAGSTDIVHVPLSKLGFGAADSFTYASSNNPYPVAILNSTILTANVTNTVVVNVTNTVVANVTNTVVVDSELPAAAAMQDNAGNPTAPAVAAHLMLWDSTAWDRALGSSVDGLLVNLGANNDVTVTGTVSLSANTTVHLGTGTNNIGTVHNSSVTVSAIAAGDNNIGNVDIVTVPTDPFGANADAASASGSISAKLRAIASTGVSISGTVTITGTSIVSGSTVSVSGSTVSVSGSTVSVSGSTVSVVNGSTFLVQPQAYTAGGVDPYSFINTTSVQAASIKASSGQVYAISMFNVSTTPVFGRLYNQTGSPASTDDANIKFRFMVPAHGSALVGGLAQVWPMGVQFGTGIGIRVTGGANDTDATGLPAAATIYGNVGYK